MKPGEELKPESRAHLEISQQELIDAPYGAYDKCPLDVPDEWGSLAALHTGETGW